MERGLTDITPPSTYRPSDACAPGIGALAARKEAELRARCAEGDNAITAEAAPIDLSRSVTVDWGSRRGQGRRSGGTVRGAMSDAPRGLRTYVDPIGGLPPEEYAEARVLKLTDCGIEDYVAARTQGHAHGIAMIYAYARHAHARSDPMLHKSPAVRGLPASLKLSFDPPLTS